MSTRPEYHLRADSLISFGTKNYLWTILILSISALIHPICWVPTMRWIGVDDYKSLRVMSSFETTSVIINVSVTLFIFSRVILAIGEAGNFPAAIKTKAEYFSRRNRAFATSIFNSGSTIRILTAPTAIPIIANNIGVEWALTIIGVGYIWMGGWQFDYKNPTFTSKVNKLELKYIQQDTNVNDKEIKIKIHSFLYYFKLKQAWSYILGNLYTYNIWWFYLFWSFAFLKEVYNLPMSSISGKLALTLLYTITLIVVIDGWIPSYSVDKKGINSYAVRIKSMLIFALFSQFAFLKQTLSEYSYWLQIVIIGIAETVHQAWSANIFSVIGDMFSKSPLQHSQLSEEWRVESVHLL